MVTVDLPYPPSANRLWRFVPGKGPLKSAEYRAWIGEAALLIKLATKTPTLGPYGLTILFGRKNKVHIDLDNGIKAVNDALKEGGAIRNDKDCETIAASWEPGLDGVRVMVLPTTRRE